MSLPAVRHVAFQDIRMPLSTGSFWPVILRDSSLARKSAALATSIGSEMPSR